MSVKGTTRVNRHLSKDCKMIVNYELLKVDKMASLKIYVSTVMEKLETSNFDSGKNLKFELHSKCSISLRR